jgi:hypothetical protein
MLECFAVKFGARLVCHSDNKVCGFDLGSSHNKINFGFVAQSITSSDTLVSTNFKNIFEDLKMNCKHRWVEVDWYKRPLQLQHPSARDYYYVCSRCSEARFVRLMTKEKAPTL